MLKTDLILKIDDSTTADWLEDDQLHISAWDANSPNLMTETHVCEEFEELEDEDIYDLSEGEMEYAGTLSKEDLINRLRELGFLVNTI